MGVIKKDPLLPTDLLLSQATFSES
jgi:hypothetical protein